MEYKVFGCKVNKYYLNQWINYFHENKIDHENIFLVASCVVTDKAKTKWIKEIKRHIKAGENPWLFRHHH